MALYLGNQKVSLRSGQDPTFDYGFDSNGRLVFANKNATEINNFLNYDSSYSEILDLSNLSKMEKVAVNGTADRKMEGLKGLLVSPNAPFTGSSPQINASYTGMNKSALVSLFESVPYNVGYTKVGNPTIVDGVISGFSLNDYFKVNGLNWSYSIKLEFVCRFKVDTSLITFTNNYTNICYWPFATYLYIGSSTSPTTIGISSDFIGVSGGISYGKVPTNQYYWIKLETDGNGNATTYSSEDGTTWTQKSTKDISSTTTGVYSTIFGMRNNTGGFPGFIDLNETYIKVNEVPWFTGKPAMTKTCSIVGATGTADLTQEDKNIILNKGWSLTVQ